MTEPREPFPVVEVWGAPEGGRVPADGRWCDDGTRLADVIYHRAPEHVPEADEWFCACCGGSTFAGGAVA